MLTLRDCLDYCDLTDDEVALFAEHAHVPQEIAGQMVCGLVQTDEGIKLIAACLAELMQEAAAGDSPERVERLRLIHARFCAAHPLGH